MNPSTDILENSYKDYFIQLTADFNWLIKTNEFFDLNRATFDSAKTIPLKTGDIVVLRNLDGQNDIVVVSTISEGVETKQNIKSVVSWQFIKNNLNPKKESDEFHQKTFIFKDVSDVWSRDKKITDLFNTSKS